MTTHGFPVQMPQAGLLSHLWNIENHLFMKLQSFILFRAASNYLVKKIYITFFKRKSIPVPGRGGS
jgi:hypothetical protein